MKFINVVPARRMPVTMQLLTYGVPDDTPIQIGQLVEVPLRGKPIVGVVWDIPLASNVPRIQMIRRTITAFPVISPWLRELLQQAAKQGVCSLSDVVYATIPKLRAPRLQTALRLDSGINVTPPQKVTAQHLRYTRRSESIQWLMEQLDRHNTVIITPTLTDVQALAEAAERSGKRVLTVTGDLSPTEQAKIFHQLLSGQPLAIVGTQRALFLPYPIAPKIIIDQVEHHAHKTQTQHPRLDTRVLLSQCSADYSTTASAASVQFCVLPDETPQDVFRHRTVSSISREGGFSWLTDETIVAMEETMERDKQILCIVPLTGYARSFTCRQCGYSPMCPHCHHAASLVRGEREALHCQHCQQAVPVLTACPLCHGVAWSYHGLGVERLRERIAEQWPTASIATTARRDVPSDIIIDTYSGYTELPYLPAVELVVLVVGDVMLNAPDFSTNERAWQYLARLQAFAEGKRIIVQTFQPEQPFWQRWLHGDEHAWYRDEVQQRTASHVPPFSTQWIVRFQGDRETFTKKIAEVQHQFTGKLRCTPLPLSPRRAVQRSILEFTDPSLTRLVPWETIFPAPWQIDTSPQSWLD